MVTVPTVRGTSVDLRNIPAATPLPTGDIAAFGGGRVAAAPLQELQKAAQFQVEFQAREALKADEVQNLEARKELATLENEIGWGENGFFKTRGKNAVGAVDRARDSWVKGTSDIEGRLVNRRQKEAFRRAVAGREPFLVRGAMKHVAVEGQRHEDSNLGAFLANVDKRISDNWADDTNVMTSIEEKKIEIAKWAARSGMGEEETQRFLNTEVSKSHSLVIGTMLNNQFDLQAKAYFDENRKEMTPGDIGRLEGLLKKGTFTGEVQRATDGLMGQTQTFATLAEAERELVARARQTGPPEFRDELVGRVQERFREAKRLEAENYNQFLDQMTRAVVANPTSIEDAIQLTDRERLKGKDLLALKGVIERAKEPNKDSDPRFFHAFWTTPPEERAKANQSEMLGLRAHLSATDWKAAVRELDRNRQALGRGETRRIADSELRSSIRRVVPSPAARGTKAEKDRRRMLEAQIFADFYRERDALPEGKDSVDAQREILRNLLTPQVKVLVDGWVNYFRTIDQLQGDYSGDWIFNEQDQRRIDGLIAISPDLQVARPSDAEMNERKNRAWTAMKVGESDQTLQEILEGERRWPEE